MSVYRPRVCLVTLSLFAVVLVVDALAAIGAYTLVSGWFS